MCASVHSSRRATTLTLQGVAQSNASVATYMRNLDNSKWLTHSDLIKTEVKGTDKRNRYEFGLNVKLRPPENAENLDSKPPESDLSSSTPQPPSPGPAPPKEAAPPKPAADKAGGTP